MKIAIAGYRGFIGSNFIRYFPGYDFIKLSRQDLSGNNTSLAEKVAGADVILSLTGYPINKRWTSKTRKKIEESRVGINRKLAEAINRNSQNPAMFITSSAIGIYEHIGKHDENSLKYGTGFMADVVNRWEDSLTDLQDKIKVTYLRFGLVLGKEGKAFRLLKGITGVGFGAVIGTGKQYYSFIHIEDVVRAIDFVIRHGVEGPVNLVCPEPVEQRVFIKTLGKKLGKHVWIHIPLLAVWLVMGKASQVVTKGQYVIPDKLIRSGFVFKFSSLEATFDNLVS